MKQIYNDIQSAIPWTTVCVRKTNTITIYSLFHLLLSCPSWSLSHSASFPTRPIQIVLRLYRSPAQIVTGFDIDGASCLYDGTFFISMLWSCWYQYLELGRRVYVTPRALAACIRQSNTIDMTRRSPSYEVRLAKYADRGFEVFFPELDRRHIDYSHVCWMLSPFLHDVITQLSYSFMTVNYPLIRKALLVSLSWNWFVEFRITILGYTVEKLSKTNLRFSQTTPNPWTSNRLRKNWWRTTTTVPGFAFLMRRIGMPKE